MAPPPVDTDESSVEEERRARAQLFEQLSDAVPVGLVQLDADRTITFTNDRLHSILGRPGAATAEALFAGVVDQDRAALEAGLTDVLSDRPVDALELRILTGAGASRVTSLSLRTLSRADGTVTGAIGSLNDITERVQLRRRTEVQADVDDLTACLNRRATLEVLAATLASTAMTSEGAVVVSIDLDDFARINDDLGYAGGDTVLAAAADRIRAAVRDVDRVGRVGDDEFLVVCPGLTGPTPARRIGERVARALHHDLVAGIGLGTVRLRASVGVAFSEGAIDPDALVARADRARDESKADRRHRPVLHVT